MGTAFNDGLVLADSGTYSYRKGMGMVPSAEWIVFFDDFVSGAGTTPGLAADTFTGWADAIIDTGCTITNGSLAGGVALITSDADNEGAATWLNTCVALSGKKFFMEVRAKTSDVSDSTFAFGLSDLTSIAAPEGLWTTLSADFITVGQFDSANPALTYDKNNGGPVTETNSATITLADDTYYTYAFTYNGGTTPADKSIKAYVDGKLFASAQTEAQIPDDLPLAPFVGGLGGATGSDTITIDYVRFALER